MPFKSSLTPEDIAKGGKREFEASFEASLPSSSNGAWQAAKSSASRWSDGGIKSAEDAAPPFGRGNRAFTQMRQAIPGEVDAWREMFRSTDAGFAFAAPPPDPTAFEAEAPPVQPKEEKR